VKKSKIPSLSSSQTSKSAGVTGVGIENTSIRNGSVEKQSVVLLVDLANTICGFDSSSTPSSSQTNKSVGTKVVGFSLTNNSKNRFASSKVIQPDWRNS